MRPTLFSFDILGLDFRFHAYTVALALAFLVGVLMAVRENYRQERPYPVTPIGGLWIFFPAIFFSKVYWYLQYRPADVWRSIFLWEGGLVFYGGLFGGVVGAIAYMRYHRVPVLPMGDIVMPFLPLAHGIARVGCFLNGCCWGMTAYVPWAVTFPKNSHAFQQQLKEGIIPQGSTLPLPVHPTQLYEAIGLFGLFFIMRSIQRQPHREGAVLFAYPLLYGVVRFFIEFFRGDVPRGWFSFTASQFVALTLIAIGCAGLAYVRLRKAPPTEAQENGTGTETDPGAH
jgi:phosphatidylglycerol:prolipoprotein diacylglycerol transferase